MLTWINGEFVDSEKATVSVFDHGLTVGDGIFETIKVVNGMPFALTRHVDRLRSSAAALGLEPLPRDVVSQACADVVTQATNSGWHRLRITQTSGEGPMGPQRGTRSPTLILTLASATPPPATTAIAVVPYRRNELSSVVGVKTTSYVENVVALRRAQGFGASEAVFANTQDMLCEGTSSNIFVVIDGEVLTPPLSAGCLDGITRALVMEWTDVRETSLDVEVLEYADEIFLTSTMRDVQAVTAVKARYTRELPAPGPVTTSIAKVFAKQSASQIDP